MQLDEKTFIWFLLICFIFTFSRLCTFVSFSSLWSYLLNKFINFTSLILVFAYDSEDAQTHLASAGSISLENL